MYLSFNKVSLKPICYFKTVFNFYTGETKTRPTYYMYFSDLDSDEDMSNRVNQNKDKRKVCTLTQGTWMVTT